MAESNNLDELRKRRLRYVESARENAFEDGLRSLLSDLYPDNAHFIYELLQNAEDARATTVEFDLGNTSLTVTHNGTRPFSLADIESITAIGDSTKRDDETQIGKFGVGFKAVFAYTTRPEIRSGEHSFAIVDLFVPLHVDGFAPPGRTTFTIPFDHPMKPPQTAADEIRRGLTELDENTLLFLHNINTVTYVLPDGAIGYIERTSSDNSTSIHRVGPYQFVPVAVLESWLGLLAAARVSRRARPEALGPLGCQRVGCSSAATPVRADGAQVGAKATARRFVSAWENLTRQGHCVGMRNVGRPERLTRRAGTAK